MKWKTVCLTATLAAALNVNTLFGDPVERVISADLRDTNGPLNTMFNFCVGAGRANEGLRADWQRQLTCAHRECGVRYIRMHGLFDDDMGVYREDSHGNPEYNWQYIDQLYDFLESIGMKPFVELSFMPDQLASGSKTIFWYRGNVTPPKDIKKWAELVRAFVLHEQQRYGNAEVRSWFFEVWNEPNLKNAFWTGTQQEYFDFYAATARAIKSVSPDYKVGGPATAGCRWVPEFIHFCDTNHAPVDFISTHTYGVESGYLDATGTSGTALSLNPDSIWGDVKRVRREIAESAMPGLQLYFTEWSSSYTPADPFHDSYLSAAYILDKLKNCDDAAQAMSYWTFTDIFEESGPRWEAFHGGFGLINYEDIKKPAFYAYQFLNRLGPIELKGSDQSSWICKDDRGDIQALGWDFSNIFPRTNMINQVFYKRDLPSKAKYEVTLDLSHVHAGKYIMETYQIGYRLNDAYDAYLDLGSPAQLTRAQVAGIESNSSGAPSEVSTIKIGHDGKFRRRFVLRENDVVMLTLTPQYRVLQRAPAAGAPKLASTDQRGF
ncbi:MAG TPA: glycoside hydrolase [Verrucomicrobiae bacterium]|nr:glycoside hydrolase [Verrucomicrobiae bacterium]